MQTQIDKVHQQTLQRLQYNAQLAENQFNQVDPNNRLVASELERRWETALKELKQTQTQPSQERKPMPIIASELKVLFVELGKKLPQFWDKPCLSRQQRKAFLRCLIDKVIIEREPRDTINVRIVWQGGAVTPFSFFINVGAFHELSGADKIEQYIIKAAKENKTDEFIAEELTSLGFQSPMRNIVLCSTVKNIRLKHKIFYKRSQSHPMQISGYLTVTQVAEKIKVSKHWVYDRIHNGLINITKQNKKKGAFLFPNNTETISLLQKLKSGILNNIKI